MNKKDVLIQFPRISTDPFSEYATVERIFPNAFPWLFPGGHGDLYVMNEKAVSIEKWIKKMIYYFDGRFAKDKMFCFFFG